MNAYERMLEVMRKQGKKDNPASIEIAYVSDGQVIHHGQKLDKDDYLITEGLSLKNGDKVMIVQINDEEYVVICKVVSA